jgi:hypothetical protein
MEEKERESSKVQRYGSGFNGGKLRSERERTDPGPKQTRSPEEDKKKSPKRNLPTPIEV